MILLLFGCDDGPSTDTDDTSGFDAADCDDSVAATLEETLIATAPRLTFSTDADVVSRVVFDNGEGIERRTDPNSGETDRSPVLIGILPEVGSSWRVDIDDGGGFRCVAHGEGETGALPSGLPEWTTDVTDASAVAPGMNLLPITVDAGQEESWLVIVDEAGRAVWAWNPTREASAPVATRGRITRARDGILFNSGGVTADGPSWFGKVKFDGTWEVAATVLGAHTDFDELPDGRIAYIGWEIREFGDQKLLGDHVSVVDSVGNVETLWRAFDNVEVDLDTQWLTGFYVADPSVGDWSHVNGISVDSESGDIFVTMAVWDGVARIDGVTGEQEWFLGEGWGDFSTPPGSEITSMPHSVRWLGNDEILVFNRDDPTGTQSCSWAADIALDTTQWTASEVATHIGDKDCTLVIFFGDATRFDNGNTLIDWSSAGRVDEVTAEDETVWSLSLDAGAVFGFSDRLNPYVE